MAPDILFDAESIIWQRDYHIRVLRYWTSEVSATWTAALFASYILLTSKTEYQQQPIELPACLSIHGICVLLTVILLNI